MLDLFGLVSCCVCVRWLLIPYMHMKYDSFFTFIYCFWTFVVKTSWLLPVDWYQSKIICRGFGHGERLGGRTFSDQTDT